MREQARVQPGETLTSHQDTDALTHPTPTFAYVVLAIGVLAVASASIFVRLAQHLGLPSTTIAAGRLGIAALILLPVMLLRARSAVAAFTQRDLAQGFLAGTLLAIHFTSWIWSLEYTSVASSAALVATNPLWVGCASIIIFRERLSRAAIAGLVLTFGGSALIGLSDSSGSSASNPLLGDALALLGAIVFSIHVLIGRNLRQRMTTLPYVWLVYTSAAVVQCVIASVVGWGKLGALTQSTTIGVLPISGIGVLVALAVGPQLIGHTSFNWSLRFLSATFVAVAILGEPIGSALLALVIFGEWFAPLQLVGFALLLVGIVVAARGEAKGTS